MSNDNAPAPNPALRGHVTDHAFVLTMRRTHIAVLNAIAHGDRELAVGRNGSLWVPAARQLGDRGLVAHQHSPNFAGEVGNCGDNINNYYRLTKAGWLVHGLLVEAGFASEVSQTSRKLVA